MISSWPAKDDRSLTVLDKFDPAAANLAVIVVDLNVLANDAILVKHVNVSSAVEAIVIVICVI